MSLADRCISYFDSGVRSRGQQYFREDRVTLRTPGRSDVRAFVHGEAEYEVVLDWGFSREQLAVCCTCPYYDEHGVCKHIWATVLAADARGAGPRGKNRLDLLAMDPEDYDDDDFDDDLWIDDDEPDDDDDDDPRFLPRGKAGRRVPASTKSGRRPPPRVLAPSSGLRRPGAPPPPKPKWQQQLSWAQPDVPPESPVRAIVTPRPKAREIWYVVDERMSGDAGKLVLFFLQRETKANGQFGKLKQLSIRPYEAGRLADAEDAEILNLLLGYHDVESQPSYYGYSPPRVSEAELPKNLQQFLLPKLAATRRLARTASGTYPQPQFDDLRPLAWDDGPPWRFRLDIRADDARQRWILSGQLYRPGAPGGNPLVGAGRDETLPVQAPRTIFKQGLVLLDDRLAPLEASGSAWMMEALRKTPAVEVPYNDRWELLRRLWQLPYEPEMNVPDNLRAEEVALAPQGRLMIDKPERYDPYRLPGRLDFLYDGKPVSAQETARGIIDEEKGRILVRNRQRERDLAASLAPRGIRPMEGWQAQKYSIWVPAQKLPEAVESLVGEGWIVEAQGYFVRRAGVWRMSVTSGVDWFDLAGTLDFDGMEVHLPEILEALRHGQNYVRLTDGSRGLLPQEWLKRFASMVELGEAEGEGIRFRSSQALLLDALLAAQEQVTVDAPFAKLRENLRSFNGVASVNEPVGFSGELRPYQKTGLGWLRFLQDFRLGGCLADDMGLGKTVQVLAMLEERRTRPADGQDRRPPSLVVVPRSLVFNWIEEAKRFTPELRVLDYTGLQRAP